MSTGSRASTAGFSSDEEVRYRPISGMAVVALLLGVVSLGAFFALPLWLAPIIGLPIAAITSRSLDRSKGEYAGQLIAKFGLFLAIVAFVGAPAVYFTKRFLIARESQPVANQYLDFILCNQIKSAFVMTQPIPTQTSMQGKVDDMILRAGREGYNMHLGNTVVSYLGGKLKSAQVTHSAVYYDGSEQGVEKLLHQYIVTLDPDREGEKPKVYSIPITMSGATSPTGEWKGRQWQITASACVPYEEKPPATILARLGRFVAEFF